MTPSRHPTLIELPQVLRGSRVTLRPYRADDAEQLHEAVAESREHLQPWVNWVDGMATIDDCRDYCIRCAAKWMLRTDLSVGIFETRTGRYLGGTGLHAPNWELRAFEIGYWVRSSAAGKGYVAEAVRLLAQAAIDSLGAKRIEITCNAGNHASRRVAVAAGFVLEGTLRNSALGRDGSPNDWLMFSLTPTDASGEGPGATLAGASVPAGRQNQGSPSLDAP